MPVPAPQPHDNQTIAVIILFLAALTVRYWREALRVLVIILIALAVLGLITGLQGLHSALGRT
jgi:cation transporter-like permease